MNLVELPVDGVVNDTANGAVGLAFDSQACQIGSVSPTTRHRCDVSSELCCPGAKSRRWIPALVTRFGVMPRVYMMKI